MRIARRVALCLMIGSAVTVAMAWIVAVTVAPTIGTSSRPSGIGDGWSYWVGRQFGTIRIMRCAAWFEMNDALRADYLAVRRRQVPSWSAVHHPSHGERESYMEEAQGWPALALRSETLISNYSYGIPTVRIRDAISLGISHERRWAGLILPLRPIWSGFVIDSLIYGALAFAILFGPGALLRAARRRRGQCLRCGYDLRGTADSGTCPECGVGAAG